MLMHTEQRAARVPSAHTEQTHKATTHPKVVPLASPRISKSDFSRNYFFKHQFFISLLVPLLYFFTYITSFAQGFYPLQVGNRWEYWEPPPPPNYYAWTTRSVGDTLMPNSQRYVILRSDGGNFDQFLRQEGARVFEYLPPFHNEYVLYDFSRSVGDTISIRYTANDTIVTRLSRIGVATVFGRTLTQWEFYEQATQSSFFAVREVTDSIGMTRIVYEPGVSFYLRGAIIDSTQYGIITDVPELATSNPNDYKLFQNYPNPFNSSTLITFRASRGQNVTVTVFDLLGRRVKTLFNAQMPSESYSLEWNGRDEYGIPVASGLYLCQLKTQSCVGSMKMALLR